MLSLLIFIPILTSILLYIFPFPLKVVKRLSLAASLAVLLIALQLFFAFEATAQMQFVENFSWIPSYGIHYHIGVDGVSLSIVMMVAILMPAISIALYDRDKKGYWLNLLLVQGGIMGAVLSLDMLLFYLFWETMLLPIFFMIGMYGYGRNHFIGMKFTMYTIFGSLIMLVGIIFMANMYHSQFGHFSFALSDLKSVQLSHTQSLLAFLSFMIAFAIKVPLFPFHTWLADTYRSAPTGAVVVMSALMAKLGVYAMWRFLFTLFSDMSNELSIYFIGLGLFGLIYFGLIAMHQNHLKRLFAFSSASHLSLIVVGIFIFDIYGLLGSAYLIAAHALTSGALFIMVGLLYQRVGTHSMDALGGIATKAPLFALLFTFLALSIVGIPGTAGFVSELLIIVGAFHYSTIIGFITATTVLIAILFMFKMLTKSIYSSSKSKDIEFSDMTPRELLAIVPIVLLIIAMGIFPNYFLSKIKPTTKYYIESYYQQDNTKKNRK